jgi:hypothetical protein
MMNVALRRFIESQDGDIEELVRRVLREELAPYSIKKRQEKR